MDGYETIRSEYNQLQQHRSLFSGLIADWLKVMIPVGGGLFGFFSWLGRWSEQGTSPPYFWFLPLLGWLFFAVAMFAWRIVAHHISRQITVLYPRMLELEQRLGWSVDTIYYYNNLSPGGRRILQGFLPQLPDQPERRNYRLYTQACGAAGVDPHGLLLHVWEQLGYQSVGSRGHAPQDVFVYITSVVSLVIALIIAYGLSACIPVLIAISITFFLIATSVFLLVICPRGWWN
jgi:hypothetical protein